MGLVKLFGMTIPVSGSESSPEPLDDDGGGGGLEEERADEDDAEDKTTRMRKKKKKNSEKVIPCPRCESTATKFCYYNNYNVNQPRHFCKNCQRYWTAGGTMRNVPVGAGRRKTKAHPSNPPPSSSGGAAGYLAFWGPAADALEKHAREENPKCGLWVPETWRIDNPREGRSSDSLFLRVNPAALSRSLSFQETS